MAYLGGNQGAKGTVGYIYECDGLQHNRRRMSPAMAGAALVTGLGFSKAALKSWVAAAVTADHGGCCRQF